MHRLSALIALIAVLYLASAASAIIIIKDTSMDYILNGITDPAFDDGADGTADAQAAVEFRRGTLNMLSPDGTDESTWYFRGQATYTPKYDGSAAYTQMQRTNNEKLVKVTREIVNNTDKEFAGYRIIIDKADYVDASLSYNGVTLRIDPQVQKGEYGQGFRQTYIDLTFENLVKPGESFTLQYTMDIHRISNVEYTEPSGDFGDESGFSGGDPQAPEPATMSLLGIGSLLALLRRSRR